MICQYFSLSPVTYQIFLNIKKILIGENFLFKENEFESCFGYNESKSSLVGVSGEPKDIFLRLIREFHKASLNKLLLAIYKIYNSDYEKYSIEKNYYDELQRRYDNVLNKHENTNKLIGRINCNNYVTKGNEFKPQNVWHGLISVYNNHNYELYKELWNVFNDHLNMLHDVTTIDNVFVVKNINLHNNADKNEEVVSEKTKSNKFKELQDLGKKIKSEIPELYCGPVMTSVVSLLMKECKTSENVLKKVASDKELIKKLFNECADQQKNKTIIRKAGQNINLETETDEKPKKVTKVKIIKNVVIKETVANEKPKKKTVPKILKNKIWNKHVGIEIGQTKCLCCKLVDISQLNFQCGHIISEKHGGEMTMENLKPICGSCNSSMGTMNMDDFIQKYKF
jgi:5-methylcytosine-specific restriction endonuclease McrA